jgi:hypothetical protein
MNMLIFYKLTICSIAICAFEELDQFEVQVEGLGYGDTLFKFATRIIGDGSNETN